MEVANYFTNRPYGSDPSQVKLMQMFAVDYDYLSAYMPAMICGRYFSEDFGGDLNRIVLNEEAVRLLGYESPEAALGQQVKMEVVDARNYRGGEKLSPAIAFRGLQTYYLLYERASTIYCNTLYFSPLDRRRRR